jgi:hypothetical protein
VSLGPLLVIGRLTFRITPKLFLRALRDDILAKYQFCNGCNTVSSIAEKILQLLKKSAIAEKIQQLLKKVSNC